MTVDKGSDFFQDVPTIGDELLTLQRVRLGYIQVGQPATILSAERRQKPDFRHYA
jgi:excinuclease UvrABC ATPase subunit